MSDEILAMVKECLSEHGKSMVSQVQCSNKLWGVLKWIVPITISVVAGITGLLLSVKVDINTIQLGTKDFDKRLTAVEASYPSIDRKLDILLGDVKPLVHYTDSIRIKKGSYQR